MPANTPATPEVPGWTVINQSETTGSDLTGRYVPGRQITFQLANGQTGSVFVADHSYTVDAVREAIMAKAAVIHSVNQISHGG